MTHHEIYTQILFIEKEIQLLRKQLGDLVTGEPKPLFKYNGPCYVRPLGRGIVLDGAGRTDLEEAVPDGEYRIEVRFFKK